VGGGGRREKIAQGGKAKKSKNISWEKYSSWSRKLKYFLFLLRENLFPTGFEVV